jgi:hypothetical protein
MKGALVVCVMMLVLPASALADPIPPGGGDGDLPLNDYLRGTAGERLFFDTAESEQTGFRVAGDFRSYDINGCWDRTGDEAICDSYTRSVGIVSVGYAPTDNLELSMRVPYVKIETDQRTYSGVSDIRVGVSYLLKRFRNGGVHISGGLKMPTGYHGNDPDKRPLGTGSYDVPLALNSGFEFRDFVLFADLGYILMGTTDLKSPTHDYDGERNIGDEVFADVAVMRRIGGAALKLEVNYFDVYDSKVGDVELEDGQEKLSVMPSVLFHPISEGFGVEFGLCLDARGRSTARGASPVLRIQLCG